MAGHDIIAIGGSAGALGALKHIAGGLPADLAATILVVIHLRNEGTSAIAQILDRAGPLRASFAKDGERYQRGHIYVAPPGRHLLLERDRLRLGTGPWENNARPAIDPLFRSAAVCCGSRVVGVVLTGYLGDGSSGLGAIKRCGGITVVQDPDDADYPEMPRSALGRTEVDHVARLSELPALLATLAAEPAGPPVEPPADIRIEAAIAVGGGDMDVNERLGKRSLLACPDCHGVMWEMGDGEILRYRCHVGHAYTADAFDVALRDDLERALGSGLRALDERAHLVRRLAEQAAEAKRDAMARQWAEKAREYEKQADLVRHVLVKIADSPGTQEAA